MLRARPLPGRDPLGTRYRWLRRAAGRRHHPSSLVPSSWFRTTSTVFSARSSRACCIPLPVVGFAAFRRNPLPWITAAGHPRVVGASCRGECGPRSSRRHDPSKSSPRSQPYRVTAACCPLAVGSLPGRSPPALHCWSAEVAACQARSSTSRRFSANGSVALDTLASGKSLVPSMGLCPLRGPIPIRGFLGLSQGDPEHPRGEVPSGRPSRRWRYTGGGALDIPACAVCPEGSFAQIPKEPCKPP